ncbi:cell division protein FtsL [Paracoccus marcusii]|nr:cell division protein FtsL [Paracoccus marcusii]WVJ73344.1 cell division protein FtsL [Paracoccus marcusii]
MRSLTCLACVLMLMGLAFWAYRENYATQAAIGEMSQVQRQIAGLREELGVLRAEWAFLNRPDRLRQLVDLNFDRLELGPVRIGAVPGPRPHRLSQAAPAVGRPGHRPSARNRSCRGASAMIRTPCAPGPHPESARARREP